MKPLSSEQKKNLLTSLPFPIAYVYQQVLAAHGLQPQKKQEECISHAFWALRSSSRLLAKTVGIIALCDYFRSYKEDDEVTKNINRVILDCVERGNYDWLRIARLLIEYFQRCCKTAAKKNRVPELLDLLEPAVQISPAINIPHMRITSRREYNWFEIMEFFTCLERELFSGVYRLSLPPIKTMDAYIYLLEKALFSCGFLHQYDLYVLAGKDDRKARGFLCRGVKSHPVGIRGMSSIWNAQKRRPFLCRTGNKHYISCFPFVAPMLQKRGERIGFRDLLIFEHGDKERLFFYAYRLKKLFSSKDCAQDALGVWQKQLGWLESHSSASFNTVDRIFRFDNLAAHHCRYFVGRFSTLQGIFDAIGKLTRGYLFLRGKAGSGKTAVLAKLYLHSDKEDLASLEVAWPHESPIFVWHFCSQLDHCDNPVLILQSLYGQILQKVFHLGAKQVASQLQKLPAILKNLQRSFEKLLEQAAKEVLQPKKRCLIVLDGLDHADSSLPSIISCLPVQLPDNVFFLLSWRSDQAKFSQDDIANHLKITDTPIVELSDSPLAPLNRENVANWVCANLTVSEENQDAIGDLVWDISHGDPFYLGLLGDMNKNRDFSDLPQERYEFLQQMWETLDETNNFLAYRMLGLLAASREYVRDEMISEILDVSPSDVERQRWRLNHFLRHDGSRYAIAHPLIEEYIRRQFRPYDWKSFHRDLLNYYYRGKQERADYRLLSDDALNDCSYHCYHLGDWQNLYRLAMDDRFKEEKLCRFKVYENCLYDISLALDACCRNQKYRETLRLGYRYAQVVAEALQGISHAFHAAAHGDYLLALERVRAIRDEQEYFKAVLLILWYALYNGHDKEALMILEDVGTIADDQVNYLVMGMEPCIFYLLQKMQEHGLTRIDCLIGKHGLKRQDALNYLFSVYEKIGFTEQQLKFFVKKLITTSLELLSSQDKYHYLDKMLPLCVEVENMENSPDMWKQLLSIIQGIKDTTLKLRAAKILGETLCSLTNQQYLVAYIQAVHNFRSLVDRSQTRQSHMLQYASILKLLGYKDQAVKLLEQSLQEIKGHSEQQTADFCRLFFEEFDSRDWQQKWEERFFSLVEKIAPDQREKVWEAAVIALAKGGDVTRAVDLLEQKSLPGGQGMAEVMNGLIHSWAVPYWESLLKQVSLQKTGARFPLLKQAGKKILEMEVAEENPIWDAYIDACRSLKEESGDESHELLAGLATGLASKGYFQKAHQLISDLPQVSFRRQALAKFAIFWTESKGDISFSLESLIEISELALQLKVLQAACEQIPAGDPGRALWKKFTTTLKNMDWESQVSGNWPRCLVSIAEKLLEDLPMDESGPLWKDMFGVIEALVRDDAVAEILCCIIAKLGHAAVFETTASFWPMIDNALAKMTRNYDKARVSCAAAVALAKLGQIVRANEFLHRAVTFAENEENPELALNAMAKIIAGYRELGQEGKSFEIFEELLRYSGIIEGKKIKNWDTSLFIVELAKMELEDFALLLAEKMLLAVVDIGDESPPAKSLARMANLFMELKDYRWGRQIFFRIIPHLSRDEGIGGEETPLYIQVTRILEKIEDDNCFRELWERTEEMVLNFSRLGMQEGCLEALAEILSRRGSYEKYQSLWQKLIADANYIGSKLESLRSKIRVGKYMARIAPLEEVEKICRGVWEILDSIASEYDKVSLLEMQADMLAAFARFENVLPFWNELVSMVKQCKRKDCQGLALLHLSKALAKRADEYGQMEFFDQSAQLLEQIGKPQQRCEGYLTLAKHCRQQNQRETALSMLGKAMSAGEELGAIYHKKLLPSIVGELASLEHSQTARKTIELLPWANRISLCMQMVEYYLKEGENEPAAELLDEALPHISRIDPQHGDQAKMYAQAALYRGKLDGILPAVALFEKALARWDSIVKTSYQKETISCVVFRLKELGHNPRLSEIWQKLYENARRIEEDTYRFWAMQEISTTLAEFHDFKYIFELLDILAPSSEPKLRILSAYARHAPEEDALRLIGRLNSEEKEVFIEKLSDAMVKRKSLSGLFQLWQEMPGNFSLLCHLTTEIFLLALTMENREVFDRWFLEVAPAWGLIANNTSKII